MRDYEQESQAFIDKIGVKFEAVLVGSDCPKFCEDAQKKREMDKINVYPRKSHIHGKHYRCTFTREGRDPFIVEFWNSYADEEQNYFTQGGRNIPALAENYAMAMRYKGKKRTKVQPYDVLACIQKHDPGTFDDFCGDFGYDTDSRRAEEIYHAVVREWRDVRRFFKPEEMGELEEIA